MARMKALCIRGTTLQYKASLFYGWRFAVILMKKMKVHRKVKVLNCLKKNITHRENLDDIRVRAKEFRRIYEKRVM